MHYIEYLLIEISEKGIDPIYHENVSKILGGPVENYDITLVGTRYLMHRKNAHNGSESEPGPLKDFIWLYPSDYVDKNLEAAKALEKYMPFIKRNIFYANRCKRCHYRGVYPDPERCKESQKRYEHYRNICICIFNRDIAKLCERCDFGLCEQCEKDVSLNSDRGLFLDKSKEALETSILLVTCLEYSYYLSELSSLTTMNLPFSPKIMTFNKVIRKIPIENFNERLRDVLIEIIHIRMDKDYESSCPRKYIESIDKTNIFALHRYLNYILNKKLKLN